MTYSVELIVEVAGALMILAAFALNQFAGLDRHGFPISCSIYRGGHPRRLGGAPGNGVSSCCKASGRSSPCGG